MPDCSAIPLPFPILRQLFSLATPLVISQLISICGGLVDLYFSNKESSEVAAIVALASAIFLTISSTLIVLMHGMSPALAESWGRRNLLEFAGNLRSGILFALLSSVLLSVAVIAYTDDVLRAFEVPVGLSGSVQQYLHITALGLPAIALARVYYLTASAIGKQSSIIVINVAALLVKVSSTWLLFTTANGGPLACAYSTLIMSYSALAVSLVFCRTSEFSMIRNLIPRGRRTLTNMAAMARLGIPGAFCQFAEIASLTVITLVIAPLGVGSIVSHQVLSQITVFCFAFPFGIGMATQILISRSMGTQRPAEGIIFARTGIALSGGLALLFACAFGYFNRTVAEVFNLGLEVAAMIGLLSPIFGVYLVFDALQATINLSLRAHRVVVLPAILTSATLWSVGVAGGLGLSCGYFGASWLHMGIPNLRTDGLSGIWLAGATALVIISILLALRLRTANRSGLLGKR